MYSSSLNGKHGDVVTKVTGSTVKCVKFQGPKFGITEKLLPFLGR